MDRGGTIPLQADGWAPATVAALLARCEAVEGDLVYDPFVGSGATLLAAHDAGLASLGCDVDPIAVALARGRVRPPAPGQVRSVEALLDASGPLAVLAAARRLAAEDAPLREACAFVAIASLSSAGWLDGEEVDDARLRGEMARLLARMQASPHHADGRAEALVLHEEALSPGRARLAALAGRRVVMVTSPPFFGSRPAPRRALLAQRLGLPAALPTSGPSDDPRAYGLLLDGLADHAASVGCAALAVEMGPGGSRPGDPDWVARLREALSARGFETEAEVPSPDAREPAWALVAIRR